MTDWRWDGFALAARVVMALVWLYNGLWLKLIVADAHHQQIVASTFHDAAMGQMIMRGIGAGETLLALGILLGCLPRLVNGMQIAVLVAMNAVGILCSGQIERPAALVISNLPLVVCAVAIVVFGPGRWVFPGKPDGLR